ncbi:efflux transporter outer membrane subunit [Duganella sp. FT134W]|uniref:Efflux transporter outer membrane subunit n=1 Tax=Duganella margarita TaxID=2692170 RepID=A0A7X4KIU9_9BURK|nr:efflux transporter outer membrane subunit [Duganella margarita]MYM73913.1 efflux transporter outer membrane subunit [Duganella margarita]
MLGKNDTLRQRLALAYTGAILLCGCAAGPDYVRPATPSVRAYTTDATVSIMVADGQQQRLDRGAAVDGSWWRLFGSKPLDEAVQQSIVANPSLQSAEANLRQSQESLKAGHGVFYPSIDAGFSFARQMNSPYRLGIAGGAGVFNLYTLGATVAYALDVFGGQRRTVEGLAAQADKQRFSAVAAYLALTGNIVNASIARAAYEAQIRATMGAIILQEEQLAIARARASAGVAPYTNALAIESELANTRATIPPLQQKADQAAHLLASLAGRSPGQWRAPTIEFDALSLPRVLPLSLPSALVRQRPDILAAEAQLHAASANVGVATAAMLPTFTIDASYGTSANRFGDLGSREGRFWNVGPSIDAPVFRGGTLARQRRAAIEGYRKAQADYRQTVLSAFVQVADALTALEHDAASVQAQARALDAARQTMGLLEANYRAGVIGYLELLVADVQFRQAQIAYLQARAQRYQDTTALFLALGGGRWSDSALPTSMRTPP